MIGLASASRSPNLDHLRTVDFLELFASGVAFGTGLTAMIRSYKERDREA